MLPVAVVQILQGKNPPKGKKKKRFFFSSDFGPLINVPYIVMIYYKMRILEAVN